MCYCLDERPVHQGRGKVPNFEYFLDSVPLDMLFHLSGYNLYHYQFLQKYGYLLSVFQMASLFSQTLI